jgi:hypothetical protein
VIRPRGAEKGGKCAWNVRDEKFIKKNYEILKVDAVLDRSIKLNCVRV